MDQNWEVSLRKFGNMGELICINENDVLGNVIKSFEAIAGMY